MTKMRSLAFDFQVDFEQSIEFKLCLELTFLQGLEKLFCIHFITHLPISWASGPQKLQSKYNRSAIYSLLLSSLKHVAFFLKTLFIPSNLAKIPSKIEEIYFVSSFLEQSSLLGLHIHSPKGISS